ncbi:MAG: hypothetical protein P8J37_09660 [Fuerstiella sp.]|nr:hypothetical protein [Fuerstiella sp.]
MSHQRLLSVHANVTIDIGDDRVFVRGDGSSVVVEVPRVSLAFQVMRGLGSIKPVRDRVEGFSAVLTRLGLTVIVRTPRRKLLTIGNNGNSWILRLFGVPNAKLHLS